MIRLGVVVLFGGAVVASLLHVNVWVVVIPLALLAVAAYTKGGMKLKCSRCGKRIKLGYSTCHHCGASYGP